MNETFFFIPFLLNGQGPTNRFLDPL